jgi:hypothetical protein
MIIAAGRERLREYILEELRLQIPRAEQAVDVSEEDRSQKERRTAEDLELEQRRAALDRKKIANALDILEREARIREIEARIREKEAVLARRLREIAGRRVRLPSRSTEKSRKRQTEPPQRKVLR